MSEHYCEYDHNRDEPCGKSAGMKWRGMWLCAEHWDWTAALFERFGIDPFDPALSDESLPLDNGEL